MDTLWWSYLAQTQKWQPSGALIKKLLNNDANQEQRHRVMESKLSGWSIASSNSEAAVKNAVWTPAVELDCYVLYSTDGSASAAERCRRAKVGLFHEVANLVLGLVAEDVCVCVQLALSNLVWFRRVAGAVDVSRVCAEDLMNAANYATTQGATRFDSGQAALICPIMRWPSTKTAAAKRGRLRSKSDSMDLLSQEASTVIELKFADGAVVYFAFESSKQSNCFCDILELVCSFRGIRLSEEPLTNYC